MYSAVFIAASGISSQQKRLDVIADNISNTNTDGFKSSRLDFKDALYTAGIKPGMERSVDGNLQMGHGTIPAAITKEFANGNLNVTNRELDVGIEGEGFFELQDELGNIFYTRLGAFTFNNTGDGSYLMNNSGCYVLDSDSQRIRVPDDVARIEISENGDIKFWTKDSVSVEDVRLGLFSFTNITGLESAGESNYRATASAGTRFAADATVVRQGALEGSNVDLALEMTRMIRTQRAFSLASRALKTADEMEGIANNMRK